jgi:hypothetical protein
MLARLAAAFQAKSQNTGGASTHVFIDQRFIRMIFEPSVVDPFHFVVIL